MLKAKSLSSRLQCDTTLLFADIAGYTRLMEMNEEETRSEVNGIYELYVWKLSDQFLGQKIHHVGDGCFLEFPSPKHAVSFSLRLRKLLDIFNSNRPESRIMEMRIGIHFGTVTYNSVSRSLDGDNVNFTSRLEQVGDTGGIWVSEKFVEAVGEEPSVEFYPLGTRRLKYFTHPTPIYGLLDVDDHELRKRYASYATIQFTTLTPTVAIVPFADLNGLEENKAQGAALTEDLKTELGNYREITILPSDINSVEMGSSTGVREKMSNRDLGKKLEADYVVEGSIYKSGGVVQVHARLLDVQDGKQLWAKKKKGNALNVIELNEQVVLELAKEFPTRLEIAVLARAKKKPEPSRDAFDNYLLGREQYRLKTKVGDELAITLLEKSIKQDPERADAYSVLGAIHGINWAYTEWGIEPYQQILLGRDRVRRAIELDGQLGRAHAHLAWTYLSTGDFDQVLPLFDKALLCNQNDVDILLLKAFAIMYLGLANESIQICNEIKELNPGYPEIYDDVLGAAYFLTHQYDKALLYLGRVADGFPENYAWLAATQAYLGLSEQAGVSIKKFADVIKPIWKGGPLSTPEDYVHWFLTVASPFQYEKDRQILAAGIRLAGLNAKRNYTNSSSADSELLDNDTDSNILAEKYH